MISIRKTLKTSLKHITSRKCAKECYRLTTKVKYLDHANTLLRLSVMEAFSKGFENMKQLHTLVELCSSHKIYSVYRDFVSNYSRIVA